MVVDYTTVEADDVAATYQIKAVEVGFTYFPEGELHKLPACLEGHGGALLWRRLSAAKLDRDIPGRRLQALGFRP
jgi:hypothetical protein